MDLWFTEKENENISVKWKVKRTLDSKQSKYQKVDILEFEEFGRALVLDGVIQTTIKDESIYHEMLAHVPLFTHPNPQRVLVVGGGDGGTVREALRHPVDTVDLVEIDEEVVNMSKKYLPELASCLDDPRVTVHIQDALKFVKERKDYYDCVLVDSSDPVGPAIGLFAKEFYQDIFNALKSDGLMAAQTESPLFTQQLIKDVHKGATSIYPNTKFYWANVPTYSIGPWTFLLASKKYDPKECTRTVPSELKYYNSEIHRASFVLPNYFKDLLK